MNDLAAPPGSPHWPILPRSTRTSKLSASISPPCASTSAKRWRPGRGERTGSIGSLRGATRTPDGLRYAGRVGAGLSDRDLARLEKKVAPLAADELIVDDVPAAESRDARWLSRGLLAEVEHGGWTGSGRLRHPVWRGLRPDLTQSPDGTVDA